MTVFLSSICLSRKPSMKALSSIFTPSNSGSRRSAQHHLLWSVFSDGEDRQRDFIWREEGKGRFLTLSHRQPKQTDLFEEHKTTVFSPALKAGGRLAFVLRANATRMKRNDKRQRVDVVMDKLHDVPQAERASKRMEIAQSEGSSWLTRQGEKSGFRVINSLVENYRTETLPRLTLKKTREPQFGILDFSGALEVTDPEIFLKQLIEGFGRAKSFGCGLMLVKRA